MADQKTGSINIDTKNANTKLNEGIDLLKDSLKNIQVGKNTTATHKEVFKFEEQGANQTAKNVKKVTEASKDANEAINELRSNLKDFGKEHYSLSVSELLKIKDDDSYKEDAKEIAKNYAKSIEEETKKALSKSKKEIAKSLKESFENLGSTSTDSDRKKFISNYISAISKGIIEGIGGTENRRNMEKEFSKLLSSGNISAEIKGFAESLKKEVQNALMLSESEFNDRKNYFLSNKQKNYKPKYEEKFSNGNTVANYFRTAEVALEQFNKAASKQNNPHEILEWGSAFELLGGKINEVDESVRKLYEDAKNNDNNKIFEKMETGFDQLRQKVEAGFDIKKIVGDLDKVSVKFKLTWNEFKSEEDFSSLVNAKKIKDRIKEIDDEFTKGLKNEDMTEKGVKKFAEMFQEINVYFDEAGKELPKKYENMLSRIADAANANYYAKTGEEKDVNLNKILDDSWFDGYDKALKIFHKAFSEQEKLKKQSTTPPQIDAGSLEKENEKLKENTEKWKENTDAINENKKVRNESKISSGNNENGLSSGKNESPVLSDGESSTQDEIERQKKLADAYDETAESAEKAKQAKKDTDEIPISHDDTDKEIKNREELREEINKTREEYKKLHDEESDIKVLNEIETFENLYKAIEKVKNIINEKNEALTSESDLVSGKIPNEIDAFNSLLIKIDELKESLKSLQDLSLKDVVDIEKVKENFQELHNLINSLDFTNDSINSLGNIVDKIQNMNSQINSFAESEINKQKVLRNEIIKTLEEFEKFHNIKGLDNTFIGALQQWSEANEIMAKTGNLKEYAMALNTKTGYHTNSSVSGQEHHVLGKMVNNVIASASEDVNTFIHSHPTNFAAFSPGDVKSSLNLLKKGIEQQLVIGLKEISSMNISAIKEEDFGKIAAEQEKLIKQYQKKYVPDIKFSDSEKSKSFTEQIIPYVTRSIQSVLEKNNISASEKDFYNLKQYILSNIDKITKNVNIKDEKGVKDYIQQLNSVIKDYFKKEKGVKDKNTLGEVNEELNNFLPKMIKTFNDRLEANIYSKRNDAYQKVVQKALKDALAKFGYNPDDIYRTLSFDSVDDINKESLKGILGNDVLSQNIAHTDNLDKIEEQAKETDQAIEKVEKDLKEVSEVKIDLTPLLSSLEQIREEITSISKSLGSIDENSGVKNLLAQFDELSQKLNEINEKAGTGINNIHLDAGNKALDEKADIKWAGSVQRYVNAFDEISAAFDNHFGSKNSLEAFIKNKISPDFDINTIHEKFSKEGLLKIDDPEKRVQYVMDVIKVLRDYVKEWDKNVEKLKKEKDDLVKRWKSEGVDTSGVNTDIEENSDVELVRQIMNRKPSTNMKKLKSDINKIREDATSNINIEGIFNDDEKEVNNLSEIEKILKRIEETLITISNKDFLGDKLTETKDLLEKIIGQFEELKSLSSSIQTPEVENKTPVSSDGDVKKEDTDFEDLLETIRLINQELETKNELILTEASIVNSNISGEVDVFNNLAKALGRLKTALSDGIFEADKIDQIKTNLKEISDFVKDINFSNDSIEALNNIINKTDELTKLAQLSSTVIGQENDALKETEKDAKKAAEAKGKFTNENEKLDEKTKESANSIEKESEALRAINIDQNTDEWKQVTDFAHQYFEELENIVSITKKVRTGFDKDGNEVNQTIYDLKDDKGRAFSINNDTGETITKDVLNIQKVYKDFEKELDRIHKLMKELGKTPNDSTLTQLLEDAKKHLDEIYQRMKDLNDIGFNLPSNLLDKFVKYRNEFDNITYKNTDTYKNAQTEIKRARSIEKERQELLYKRDNKIITDDEKSRLANLNAENALIENAVNGLREQTEAGRKLKETYEQIKKEAESIRESSVTNQITSDMQKNRDKAQNLLDSGRVLPNSRETLQNAVNEANRHLQEGIDSNNINAANGALEKLIQELNEVQKVSDKASMSKLGMKIEKTMRENSAMSSELKGKFEELKQKIKELINEENYDAEAVRQLGAEYESLKYQMELSGKTGLSFFDAIKDRAMNMSKNFLSMYLSLYDITRYVGNGVRTIVELDDALVDLSKTAHMSQSQLDDFYHGATATATEMGVTTKEIIDQASAWSRLGYNTAETATQMAKISSQFASISPGMDTEQAQEGLVSIMKAWDIPVDKVISEISDKINILGKALPKPIVI